MRTLYILFLSGLTCIAGILDPPQTGNFRGNVNVTSNLSVGGVIYADGSGLTNIPVSSINNGTTNANLFYAGACLDNKIYSYSTGAPVDYTTFCSGLIAVTPGRTYTWTFPYAQGSWNYTFDTTLCCYDSNRTFLGLATSLADYTWVTNEVSESVGRYGIYDYHQFSIQSTSRVCFVGQAFPAAGSVSAHTTSDFIRWISLFDLHDGTNITGIVSTTASMDTRIAFVGDSLTATASSGWTTNLGLEPYFRNFQSTNVAVSGYRTAWMMTNLWNITNWLVRPTPSQTRFCWIFGGYNDISYSTNLVDTEANLAAMWSACTNLGVTPIVSTLWCTTNDTYSQFLPMNTWIRSNYSAYGAILVDLEKVMQSASGSMTYDGLHPSTVGNLYIQNAVSEGVQKNAQWWGSTVIATNNGLYVGSQAPKPVSIGTSGNTNLTLNTDSSVTVNGSVTLATNSGITFFGGYNVASLPTPAANNYTEAYANDVVTPRGIGGYVRWNGTQWLIRDNVVATSDVRTFIVNSRRAGLVVQTPITTTMFAPEFYGSGCGIAVTGTGYGTGSGAFNSSAATSYGDYCALETGTTAPAGAYLYHIYVTAFASGDFYSFSAAASIPTLSDGTDIFWSQLGLANGAGTNFPTSGVTFMYDPSNVNSHGITGAATNNWICVSVAASSATFADSGLPVTTSSTSPDRLMIIASSTNATFYTNGVLCATISSNIPSATLVFKASIMKLAGTSNRAMREWAPMIHLRRAIRTW
jgi:hypothetical protein